MSEVTQYDGRFEDEPVSGDIIEPPVTTQLGVPNNPFAVATPDHLSAGAVAIESQRGIAEVQGRMLIAKRFPRDSALAYSRTMNACLRIGLAREAIYKFNRGGTVEGPSIRLAEEMARCWGNIEYGLNELSRRAGESEMEAFAWDLETNTRSSQRFTVRHIRERGEDKGGSRNLDGERDIYEVTANMGARRMRSRILAILPPELVRDALARCRQTVRDGGGEPLEDRIRRMMAAFQQTGVTAQMIIDRLGHPIDRITPDELVDLGGIYQSIRDDQSKRGEWFGAERKEPAPDADPFERAAAGVPNGEPKGTKSPETKNKKADAPPAETAAEFLARLEKMTIPEIERLDHSAQHRSWLRALSPAEQSEVNGRMADRLIGRGGA